MSEELSAPDVAHLRYEFAAIVEALLAAPPVYYRWGGCTTPLEGFDCSGLVVWACERLSTPLPMGRPNTDALWDGLAAVAVAEPGDLALYGTGSPSDPACHVMVCIRSGAVAGMSGGGHKTVSTAIAKLQGAKLKSFPTHLYRKDFIGFRRIPFEKVRGL